MGDKVDIIEIEQYYSRYPLYVKIGIDMKWAFIKLNKGGTNKKTPNNTVDKYFV